MKQNRSPLFGGAIALLSGAILAVIGVYMSSIQSKPCLVLGCGDPTGPIRATGSLLEFLGIVLGMIGVCACIINFGGRRDEPMPETEKE